MIQYTRIADQFEYHTEDIECEQWDEWQPLRKNYVESLFIK